MDPKKQKRLSHKMSALLRHRASSIGLAMDKAGWVAIDDLLGRLRISRAELERVVAHNNKTRYQIQENRIRASQGHSLEGMPVTLEGLEASWSVYTRDASIWHGTPADAVESIARSGIVRSKRTHVHLAESTQSHVGKRAHVGVLLEVCPKRLRSSGYEIFRSPNGVILTRHVPPWCIVNMLPISRHGKQRARALRAALGLSP